MINIPCSNRKRCQGNVTALHSGDAELVRVGNRATTAVLALFDSDVAITGLQLDRNASTVNLAADSAFLI